MIRTRFKVVFVLILSVAFLGSVRVAHAEADNLYQRLLSKGIGGLERRDLGLALQNFEEALAMQPEGVEANYYLGVTHARANRFNKAERHFLKAISIERTFMPAQFDLGVLYYQNKKDQKALRLFSMVQGMDPDRARVYFYQGVILRRNGKTEEGDAKLDRALALDSELAAEINFLRGAGHLQAGQSRAARKSLQEVITLTPEGELADAARDLLAQTGGASGKKKRLSLQASLGLQYDDNVILEPRSASASAAGITKKSDFVGLLYLLAKYAWLQGDDWRGDLKYTYFLNFHQDSSLTDFDVQDNHFSASVGRRFGKFDADIEYTFQVATLGGETYILAHRFRPRAMLHHSRAQISELVYQFGMKDFEDIPLLFPANSERDVKTHFLGFSHYLVYLQDGVVYGTLLYEMEAAGDSIAEDDWGYDAFGLKLGTALPPWHSLTAAFELNWRMRQYKNPNQLAPLANPGLKREDDDLLFIVSLSRPLNDALDLSAQYLYQLNDSNIAAFDYRRNIVGFIITAKY